MKNKEPGTDLGPAQKSTRRRTLILLGAATAAIVAAMAIGISDNLPGLAMLYLGVAAAILAWVHRWRRAKNYLILMLAALFGFPFAVLFHNMFYALGELGQGILGVKPVTEALHVLFFFVAVLVCPAALFIGGAGSLVAWLRARESGVGR